MQPVVAGQAPITLEWNTYLGSKTEAKTKNKHMHSTTADTREAKRRQLIADKNLKKKMKRCTTLQEQCAFRSIAAAAAAAHTRLGSASPYARLVGLTLAPFVRVHIHIRTVVRTLHSVFYMFPASHLESRHNIFETKTLQHGMSNKRFL